MKRCRREPCTPLPCTCEVSRVAHLPAGVIAVVVYGLYGNAYSHFELGSSRHMHELGEHAGQPVHGDTWVFTF